MEVLIVILLLVVLTVVLAVVLYNRLVALRLARANAFADVDVQLKQRADLVPNLVETVKGFASQERDVLTQVTEARSQAIYAHGDENRLAAENTLGMALTKLMAVAESYPDLKSNENFLQLQRELSDIENKLAAARRFFNNSTRELNEAVQQFPSSIIANFFHFREAPFFDVGEQQRAQLEEPTKVTFKR